MEKIILDIKNKADILGLTYAPTTTSIWYSFFLFDKDNKVYLTHPSHCREIFTERIIDSIRENWDELNNNCIDRDGKSYIAIFINKIGNMKDNIKKSLQAIHKLEKMAGWHESRLFKSNLELRSDMYVIEIDSKWMRTTHYISLFLLLLKMANMDTEVHNKSIPEIVDYFSSKTPITESSFFLCSTCRYWVHLIVLQDKILKDIKDTYKYWLEEAVLDDGISALTMDHYMSNKQVRKNFLACISEVGRRKLDA